MGLCVYAWLSGFIRLWVYPFIRLSVYGFIRLSVYSFICFIYLFVRLNRLTFIILGQVTILQTCKQSCNLYNQYFYILQIGLIDISQTIRCFQLAHYFHK